jgi:hypothetical protein
VSEQTLLRAQQQAIVQQERTDGQKTVFLSQLSPLQMTDRVIRMNITTLTDRYIVFGSRHVLNWKPERGDNLCSLLGRTFSDCSLLFGYGPVRDSRHIVPEDMWRPCESDDSDLDDSDADDSAQDSDLSDTDSVSDSSFELDYSMADVHVS